MILINITKPERCFQENHIAKVFIFVLALTKSDFDEAF